MLTAIRRTPTRLRVTPVGRLIAIVRDEGDACLPDLARQVLQVLAAQIEQLEADVDQDARVFLPKPPEPRLA